LAAAPAPMRFPGHPQSRQLQYRFNRRASGHVDQLFQGQIGPLNQLHQRQQPLPVLGQPARQSAPVLAAHNLIALLHGGSLQRSFASTRSYEIAPGEPPSLQLPTKTGTPSTILPMTLY